MDAVSPSDDFGHQIHHGRNMSTQLESNLSNQTYSEHLVQGESPLAFEKIVAIVVPIIFGLIALLGLCGNLLVIIVVVSNKQMRNTTNLLIINLAVADLLFIIICVPFLFVRCVLWWGIMKKCQK